MDSSSAAARPLATTVSMAPAAPHNSGVDVTFRRRASTTRFAHAPLVMAMLTNNRLSNCSDISAMVRECEANGNTKDQVCRTAVGYLDMCLSSE
jgi:hypothetical protein